MCTRLSRDEIIYLEVQTQVQTVDEVIKVNSMDIILIELILRS